MQTSLRSTALAMLLLLAVPPVALATDVDGPNDCQRTPTDFGDAPEGALAYTGVTGRFPTCLAPTAPGTATSACGAVLPAPGPTGFVRHQHPTSGQYWLGCAPAGFPPQGIDGEGDGKTNDSGGPLSACNQTLTVDCFEAAFGFSFGQDECYGGTDAGVPAAISFSTCANSSVTFNAFNCSPTAQQVRLNVLIDWNHDGDWNDEVACPGLPNGCTGEWVVQNALVVLAPGCNAITSPTFVSGPTTGPAWMRITISTNGVAPDFSWNGSAGIPGQTLANGETEDYPVTLHDPPAGCLDYEDWGDAPEEFQAYPGIPGRFPTCGAVGAPGTRDVACPPISTLPGPTGFVRHLVSAASQEGYWLGCGDGTPANPGVDGEIDGKVNDTGALFGSCLATLGIDCTEFLGLNWGQDECYGDLDAGLPAPNLVFKACQSATVDFRTFNCKQGATDVFLNILVDMNEDGDWNDNFLCSAAGGPCAYEWAVKNVPIVLLPGCRGQTSPAFLVGPKTGKGWMRITLTSQPVSEDFPWSGSAGPTGDGAFFSGETEDYPVVIRPDNVGVGSETSDDFTQLALSKLVPNPAKNSVLVRFSLPRRSDVSLAAFDVSGRKLADLARGRLEAGEHRIAWDFEDSRGRPVAAGYYIVKLRVGDRVLTQRGIRVR
jgi:hypothetical protein